MSWPAADLDEQLLQFKFSEHLMHLKLLELDKNNKNEQTIIVVEDNVIASARMPPEEKVYHEVDVQTQQEKIKDDAFKAKMDELRSRMTLKYQPEIMQSILEKREEERRKRIHFKSRRGGKRSFFDNAIEEDEDASDHLKSPYDDGEAKRTIPTQFAD